MGTRCCELSAPLLLFERPGYEAMNLVAPNLGANGGVFSDAVLFQSFIANVDGIKFYEGHLHLRSVMRVLFERELSNPHDSNGYSGEACPSHWTLWGV